MIAILITLVTSWVAYDRVENALRGEFEARLTRVATTAASQIDPQLVGDIETWGEDSDAYSTVMVQLVTLQSPTGYGVLLIDSLGVVMVNGGAHGEREGRFTVLDSLARPALDRALAGLPTISEPFARGDSLWRAAFAPVREGGGPVAGVVAIEADPAYVPVLGALGRTLALIALISVIAIAVLAAFVIRAQWSAARLERRLSRAENLAAMGRLTATLAHEIKNPLAIIRGSAQRLQKLEPEAQRMAEFVIEETDRLSRTVARYLQFARGGEELRESGDAAAALEATLDLLEGEFQARHVRLERTPGGPRPARVALDNESLKQVYLNLILNALDAMPDGGRLQVSERERHGRYEVIIADEGQGIPPEVLRRLGSPFFTTKAQGSGLGLFLARRLVQTSGGELDIQSRVGQGTTCILGFPRWRG